MAKKKAVKKIYKWSIEHLKIVSETGEVLEIKAKKGKCILKDLPESTRIKLIDTIKRYNGIT